MSTAVALHDIQPSAKDNGTVQYRAAPKVKTRSSLSSQEGESWVTEPQDAASLQLPLDSCSFVPTRTYWITPHGMLTKEITVLDLTTDLQTPFVDFSNAYKDEVKKTLKDHTFTPIFSARRTNWLGLKYIITGSDNQKLADWKHPWSSVGEATLTFPEGSPHSSHTISLKNKRWGLRTESFTINSVPFIWEMNSLWHSNAMTLFKVYGSGEQQKRVEVGKYAQKWWGSFVCGGTFVVDENEIDGFIACLTLLVILKKKRQRAAEKSGGSSGGDGG